MRVLVPIFIVFLTTMSALLVLGVWFAYQFLIGLPEIAERVGIGSPGLGSSQVAWMAHVGGFVFGLIGIYILGGRPHPAPALSPYLPTRRFGRGRF